jgi:hypothetical protein
VAADGTDCSLRPAPLLLELAVETLLPMAVTAPRCYSLAETVIFDFVIEIDFFMATGVCVSGKFTSDLYCFLPAKARCRDEAADGADRSCPLCAVARKLKHCLLFFVIVCSFCHVACPLYGCKPNSLYHAAWVGKFFTKKIYFTSTVGHGNPCRRPAYLFFFLFFFPGHAT